MVLGNLLNQFSARTRSQHVPRRQGGLTVITGSFDPATAALELADLKRRLSSSSIGAGSPRDRAAFLASVRRGARAQMSGSVGEWSSRILFTVETGRDMKWLAGVPSRTASVTYDQVRDLASTELTAERATWFVSGPRDTVTAVYAAIGVEPTWINP